MADDLIFEIHYVTPFGREAYCGDGAVAELTRDVQRVTCGDCQATEAFREEADLVHFAETTPESRETEPDTIMWLRQVRASQQCGKRDGALVDVVTADAVLTVYDALASAEVKAKIAALSMPRMATVAWKLLSRAG